MTRLALGRPCWRLSAGQQIVVGYLYCSAPPTMIHARSGACWHRFLLVVLQTSDRSPSARSPSDQTEVSKQPTHHGWASGSQGPSRGIFFWHPASSTGGDLGTSCLSTRSTATRARSLMSRRQRRTAEAAQQSWSPTFVTGLLLRFSLVGELSWLHPSSVATSTVSSSTNGWRSSYCARLVPLTTSVALGHPTCILMTSPLMLNLTYLPSTRGILWALQGFSLQWSPGPLVPWSPGLRVLEGWAYSLSSERTLTYYRG